MTDHYHLLLTLNQFDVITRFLSGSNRDIPPSMLLDRADDDMLTLAGSITSKRISGLRISNKFIKIMLLELVGFDGVVLEVTETNYVAGITVF